MNSFGQLALLPGAAREGRRGGDLRLFQRLFQRCNLFAGIPEFVGDLQGGQHEQAVVTDLAELRGEGVEFGAEVVSEGCQAWFFAIAALQAVGASVQSCRDMAQTVPLRGRELALLVAQTMQ
jgi:hypothetical protein